ncbi:hypothetical protein LSH36_138g02015 [Paralvinella palmiformis]|uniref:Uncharacterized protein n=1 Tax=Paralvinella palmiformis TaxID=53620 RepID=A0AAD9JW14_9ANNE|nr:hypothetical protein LSH36_138g02015 [Paralvinella palmiformis]
MFKYAALQNINYDSLQLNHNALEHEQQGRSTPRSLQLQCCAALCEQGGTAAAEALSSVPSHLAPVLLQEAMMSVYTSAIANIIANWPLPTLCFREVLCDVSKRDVFDEEMGLNVMLFKGITSRTKKCQLKTLDLRGLTLNWNFTKLIVQMWPLLSLKKTQRNVKRLTNIIIKTAGLKRDNRLAKETIPKILEELLNHDMAKHPAFTMHIAKGARVVVKLDYLEFSTQNNFFMEYLLANCLRSVTPLTIEPANIIIKSDLNVGDQILESIAPFIVFRGQDPNSLEGIWLENLEDNVFFVTCQDLEAFNNMTALAFPNCNIMLQEGRTRCRTSTRVQFTNMLSHFSQLTRLDLSQNSFAGCLREVLDALVCPLKYLSLRECDLIDRDIIELARSRHSTSLRHLDLSRICGLIPDDPFAVSTVMLLRNMRYFSSLSVVHLQQNQITDSNVDQLCQLLTEHWHKLKSFNITQNILSGDSVLRIVQVCSRTSIHHLRLPYLHNFLENFDIFQNACEDFSRQVKDVLKRCGRSDVEVQVCGLPYAVFGHV